MALIYCLMCFSLFVGFPCWSLFCYALLCVLTSFAIILKWKKKLAALLLLSYRCIVTVKCSVVLPYGAVVGLQCVIVVFHDHTHLLFKTNNIPTKQLNIKFNWSKCK